MTPLGGPGHVPVLLAEVIRFLAPRAGGIYLDATFGGGGYAEAILESAPCTLWAIDRDPDAIARGASLAARHDGRLHLLEGQFSRMRELLGALGIVRLDGVAMDLGVSSFQLDEGARGFSFRADGPLDMRMDKGASGATPSAAELVATLSESELARILAEYGEERFARRAARAIVAARAEAPITTTGELARILRQAIPRGADNIDPATRGFQALRIAVNDELGELEAGLEAASALLAPGGRLVVVSFHSLEDRIVKRFMAERAGRAPRASRHDPASLRHEPDTAASFRLLTAKPVAPGQEETERNPRARSSRLRALERLPVEAA